MQLETETQAEMDDKQMESAVASACMLPISTKELVDAVKSDENRELLNTTKIKASSK